MEEKRLVIGGAVITAIAASLCCVGPVLFAVLGLGAFGAASLFEVARPYLLTGAVLLLAGGFYWTISEDRQRVHQVKHARRSRSNE